MEPRKSNETLAVQEPQTVPAPASPASTALTAAENAANVPTIHLHPATPIDTANPMELPQERAQQLRDRLQAKSDATQLSRALSRTAGPGNARTAEQKKLQNAVAAKEAEKKRRREAKKSALRKPWVCLSYALTWCCLPFMLSFFCRIRGKSAQLAWREKIAMCFVIFVICAGMAFLVGGLGRILCPKQDVMSHMELANYKGKLDKPWVAAYGKVYKIDGLIKQHTAGGHQIENIDIQRAFKERYVGEDISYMFRKSLFFEDYCPGIPAPSATWDNMVRDATRVGMVYNRHAPRSREFLDILDRKYWQPKGRQRFIGLDIANKTWMQSRDIYIYKENIYDMSQYFKQPERFLGDKVKEVLGKRQLGVARDITKAWDQTVGSGVDAQNLMQCMNAMFFIGVIDHRQELQCVMTNWILFATTLVLVVIVLFKFMAALHLSQGDPSLDVPQSKFVMCLVPCYTENRESLKTTFDSIAALQYDGKRRLLFVICDGMVIGSGNHQPNPEIVLDVLGAGDRKTMDESEAHLYESIGSKKSNRAKVFSGLYSVDGHTVPYVVVVKCGMPTEDYRPGNRGKRDSQVLIMRFLSRVHFDEPMSPLDLELYHQMSNVIGIPPFFFEYMLMIDADTEVFPDSLNRLVAYMEKHKSVAGLSGETLLANPKQSLATMVQVYEYFISHHIAKAFESLFGSVTCLPGCFSMYRLRTSTKRAPLLIAPALVADYGESEANTLHTRNLLHLGEDRYLTTLMMRHFPKLRFAFTPDAKCKTYAPEEWSVLLSQRRRWINSTVHNLLELMLLPNMCGMCCFSMRFVVFIELFSTIVMPVGVLYIGYLAYVLSTDENSVVPMASVLMLGATYGLQMIVFVLKGQAIQVLWMFLYLLATPLHSFFLPIYSFWHFDDFSWGSTHVVVDENGKKMALKRSDTEMGKGRRRTERVPRVKWEDHAHAVMERELAKAASYELETAEFTPGETGDLSQTTEASAEYHTAQTAGDDESVHAESSSATRTQY